MMTEILIYLQFEFTLSSKKGPLRPLSETRLITLQL